MIKLSIVVPVYNVENYIKECISSLLEQTLEEIEILVVNDGTKDKSIEIVKEFNDERISILNKENGGLSSARNYGLKHAKGEYVCFFDSDDFINGNDSYEKMYNMAKQDNLDVLNGVFSWYYSENDIRRDSRYEYLAQKEPMSGCEYLKKSVGSNSYLAIACTQIYKRELLVENDLTFKEGLYHEDEQFTPRVLLKAQRVNVIPLNFYMYRQREGSIMSTKENPKRKDDIFNTVRELSSLIDKSNDEELKLVFRSYLIGLVLKYAYMYKLKKVPNDLRKKYPYDALTKNVRIKLKLLNIYPSLFYIFQDLISKVRG